MSNLYYTYILIDLSTDRNTIFYVGKGKGNRMYYHWRNRNLKRSCNYLLKKKLKELESKGQKPAYEKVLVNVSEQEAFNKERELILMYGRIDLGLGTLCNLTDGGDGYIPTLEQRERRRKVELDKQKGKPVNQFDLDGTFIKTFPSAKVASEHIIGANQSYITQYCKGKRKSAGRFQWTYKSSTPPTNYHKQYERPVLQFNLVGEFVARYQSVSNAATSVGKNISTISNACSGKIKRAAGFIWKYEDSCS